MGSNDFEYQDDVVYCLVAPEGLLQWRNFDDDKALYLKIGVVAFPKLYETNKSYRDATLLRLDKKTSALREAYNEQ